MRNGIEKMRDQYDFGPEFRVEREGRPALNIITFGSEAMNIHFFMAIDDQGTIVGKRHILKRESKYGWTEYIGHVYMSPHSRNATNQFEQAFLMWMQMRADETVTNLKYTVTNENEADRVRLGAHPDTTPAQRDLLEQEQQRWQALYG